MSDHHTLATLTGRALLAAADGARDTFRAIVAEADRAGLGERLSWQLAKAAADRLPADEVQKFALRHLDAEADQEGDE